MNRPMQTPKQEAEAMIRSLPDDATFEDMQYRLYVLETLHERMEAADRGEVLDEAEADKRMARWLSG